MKLHKFHSQSVLEWPMKTKRRWLPFWLLFGTLIWACHDSRFEGRDVPLSGVQLASAAIGGVRASAPEPTEPQLGAELSTERVTREARLQGEEIPPTPTIRVRAFHDRNLNGQQDEGEEEIIGWPLNMTDPNLATAKLFAPAMISAATPGTYTFIQPRVERSNVSQTVSQLDGVALSRFPAADPMVAVLVSDHSDPTEDHEVVFGNVGLAEIKSCTVYDRDANGEVNSYEPGVPGWQLEMSGIDASEATVGPLFRTAGPDGCVSFGRVLPGEYTVTQLLPTASSWTPSAAQSRTIGLESSVTSSAAGESLTLYFTNYCEAETRFETADYWLDRGRARELTHSDLAYLTRLPVTNPPSTDLARSTRPEGSILDRGLLDSSRSYGPAPDAAAGMSDEVIWSPEGFTSDPGPQLSNQLVAFVLNARHRLDSPEAHLWDGSRFVSPRDIVAAALDVPHDSPTDRKATLNELNGYNTASRLRYIPFAPCPVSY